MATPPITAPVMPDGLAVPPIGVVRSRVKMDAVTNTEARLQRAKERLYVLCQAGGWIFFLVLQVVFIALFRSQDTAGRATPSDIVMSLVRVIAEGLLVTHYARIYLTRWGWKDLGWRPLIPRILGLAIAMSAIWTAAGFALDFGLLRIDPPTKFPLWLLMTSSLVNGAIMMTGWLCIYFFYHLFERLNRLQLEQLKLAATVKEAELRALKSQVNPHFLFNSLNSLRALIDEDAPRAREAVTRLANMLRYSLQSGQQELCPSTRRCASPRITWPWSRSATRTACASAGKSPRGPRGLHVPPMLLQTLVENAVKYGISPRREGGELVISARRVASDARTSA
jgi:hypothetical protein